LVSVLDTDIKNVLFWKYAKVRLHEEWVGEEGVIYFFICIYTFGHWKRPFFKVIMTVYIVIIIYRFSFVDLYIFHRMNISYPMMNKYTLIIITDKYK
jgi:hypothetical protein